MNTYKVRLYPWRQEAEEKIVKADYFEVTHSGALVFFMHEPKGIQAFSQWGSVTLWDADETTTKVAGPYWGKMQKT